jgi:lipopolysaccharide export system permease protein
MTLPFYFFRQFLPPFLFGSVLFSFVLLLDKLFDIIDLLLNKGVGVFMVARLFALFIPTILPLTFPMALLLACLVTFGRLSEENELTAVRSAGISLLKALWLPPVFALVLSVGMIPFNTQITPWASQSFQHIYEKIVQADPLINIEPKKFFSLKNIKIYAENVDDDRLTDVFVYQLSNEGRPADRIFARNGFIHITDTTFTLTLKNGQVQKFDPLNPSTLLHTGFDTYRISAPMNMGEKGNSTKFRSLTTHEIKTLIRDLKAQGQPTSSLEAENSLRYAVAFAPICLVLVGIPLATVLKKGGRAFGFGITIVAIFVYYVLLIFGVTLAEKAILPSTVALWIANIACLTTGGWMFRRMVKT